MLDDCEGQEDPGLSKEPPSDKNLGTAQPAGAAPTTTETAGQISDDLARKIEVCIKNGTAQYRKVENNLIGLLTDVSAFCTGEEARSFTQACSSASRNTIMNPGLYIDTRE